MKVLIIFDHPRRDFCGAVLDHFAKGLLEAGHGVELADLRAENFDPRMPRADEPDWNNVDKIYSDEVLAEQRRVERNDALAFIFPVFWWSFPATTKGWIDRVWNYGWAYVSRKLHHSKALLIGVNAGDEAGYRKRDYDNAMRVQLLTGVIDYCGIRNGSLELFYDALESDQKRAELVDRVKRLGLEF